MGGLGGRGKQVKAKQAKKPRRGSGNPAKRVEDERAAALRRTHGESTPADAFELPSEFKNLLPPG